MTMPRRSCIQYEKCKGRFDKSEGGLVLAWRLSSLTRNDRDMDQTYRGHVLSRVQRRHMRASRAREIADFIRRLKDISGISVLVWFLNESN